MSTNRVCSGKRILIVDDEPDVLEAARRILEFLGHDVRTAKDGPSALALFKSERFHIVLTDYLMPEMRGDELADELRSIRPGQPIVMITAYADMLPPMKSVNLTLSKPFLLQHLRDAVDKLTSAVEEPQAQT